MSDGDTSIYTTRGAQPRPLPSQGAGRSPWRGLGILVVVMFGWMLVVFLMAAIASPRDPNVEVPIEVGRGVVVTPADGWYSAADVWDVGPNAASLQRAGAFVAFAVDEYAGTNEELLAEELAALETEFDSYRELPAAATTVAGDLPGLTVLFSGTSDSSRQEGELVVATYGGTGILMLAIAPEGQLARVQGDLDTMLDTLVVPR